jgi:hypothetical protein
VVVDVLCDCGCCAVGPAPRLAQGLMLAAVERLDGALLDVNLAGEACFPIAAALDARGIPFAFLTGYSDGAIPAEYREVPRLMKPFTNAALRGLVAGRFAAGA